MNTILENALQLQGVCRGYFDKKKINFSIYTAETVFDNNFFGRMDFEKKTWQLSILIALVWYSNIVNPT
jgi:hypothetical protein